jgi:hypothetical protein
MQPKVETMQPTEGWEKEFDEKFPPVSQWSQRQGDYTESPIPHIKAFISKELSSARAEAYEEGIDKAIEIIEGKWASQSELKDDIIESIKTFKEPTIEK